MTCTWEHVCTQRIQKSVDNIKWDVYDKKYVYVCVIINGAAAVDI